MTGTTKTTTATRKPNFGTAKATSCWKSTTATKSPIQSCNPVRVSGSRSCSISGSPKAKGSNRPRPARVRRGWIGRIATGRSEFERTSGGSMKEGGSGLQQEEALASAAVDVVEESDLDTAGAGGGSWGRRV